MSYSPVILPLLPLLSDDTGRQDASLVGGRMPRPVDPALERSNQTYNGKQCRILPLFLGKGNKKSNVKKVLKGSVKLIYGRVKTATVSFLSVKCLIQTVIQVYFNIFASRPYTFLCVRQSICLSVSVMV